MLKAIAQLSDHYIVCGIGRVGTTVTHELAMTGRPFLVVDIDRNRIDEHREHNPNVVFLHGDAAEDAVLAEAGIARAAGVFAITGDDAKNLVISLSAKQLNPAARVVARCHEARKHIASNRLRCQLAWREKLSSPWNRGRATTS